MTESLAVPRLNTLPQLVEGYTSLRDSPYTKAQALHSVVAWHLRRSCNYFHRQSTQGKGNKAARREAVVRSLIPAPDRVQFSTETYHPMKRRINFKE